MNLFVRSLKEIRLMIERSKLDEKKSQWMRGQNNWVAKDGLHQEQVHQFPFSVRHACHCGRNGNNWTLECKKARIFDPKI